MASVVCAFSLRDISGLPTEVPLPLCGCGGRWEDHLWCPLAHHWFCVHKFDRATTFAQRISPPSKDYASAHGWGLPGIDVPSIYNERLCHCRKYAGVPK